VVREEGRGLKVPLSRFELLYEGAVAGETHVSIAIMASLEANTEF